MGGFIWAGDLNGHKNAILRKSPIPNATAVKKGDILDFTVGTGLIVFPQPEDFDDPIFAVATETKAVNDGKLEIEVSYSPTAVYRYDARSKAYTLTGGSTTTAVDSSLLPNNVNNQFKGGAIRIVTCAADPSLNGKIVKITGSTAATGTLTLAETLPVALAAGDTVNIVLGAFAEGYFGYDLTATGMNVDFDAIGGECLQFLYSNPDTMEMFFRFRLHKFAQHALAL